MTAASQVAAAPNDGRAKRVVKVLLAVILIPLLVVAVIVLVLAMTPWGNERVRRIVVSQANQRMTGALTVAALRGNLLSGASLTHVELLDSLHHPVFAARRVQLHYGLLAALRGQGRHH